MVGKNWAGYRILKAAVTAVLAVSLSACLGMPEKVSPVDGFELNRYLGKWYEIARLDHSFERGLESVSAEYALRNDGGVSVVNRGYSPGDGEWKAAEGKAYFVEDEHTGYLKVSFFGPFYGSYVVFELDKKDYQYAFVSGPNTSYLWLLSRTPEVAPDIIERFKHTANERGFDMSELIFVNHADGMR
jgi:apolipoprotein D and lipocalin family protein